MNAIILSIGDELVLGQTIDTNSAWLSQQLGAVGCNVVAHMTVPDDQKLIESAIRESAGRCDFLLITGGIGPTADDLTRQALAKVMNVELELNEKWLHRLKAFFRARGREMPEMNTIQAMIPRGATMIENTCGTAAGIRVTLFEPANYDFGNIEFDRLSRYPLGRILIKMGKITRTQIVEAMAYQKEHGGLIGEVLIKLGFCNARDREIAVFSQKGDESATRTMATRVHACDIFVSPGVPKEMKAMFTRDVLPHIHSATGGAVILSRTLHTFGLGESVVAEMLGDLMNRDRNPSVGTTVSNGIVSLRINARFESRLVAQQQLDQTLGACRDTLGNLIFGEEDQTLQQVVAALLASSRQTVTTAESCTGGLLAKMLTDIPGSSDYFKTGFITYSNQSKHEQLGVPMELIEQHGAVSENVVAAMAERARQLASADIALAISGIAGPTGGTAQKPVGTVCIALADAKQTMSRTFNFPGDREFIRDRAAKMALSMLRFNLLGKPMPF